VRGLAVFRATKVLANLPLPFLKGNLALCYAKIVAGPERIAFAEMGKSRIA